MIAFSTLITCLKKIDLYHKSKIFLQDAHKILFLLLYGSQWCLRILEIPLYKAYQYNKKGYPMYNNTYFLDIFDSGKYVLSNFTFSSKIILYFVDLLELFYGELWYYVFDRMMNKKVFSNKSFNHILSLKVCRLWRWNKKELKLFRRLLRTCKSCSSYYRLLAELSLYKNET